MARRRATRRSTQPFSLTWLLLIVATIAAYYFWQQGTLPRWLRDAGWPVPELDLPPLPGMPAPAPPPAATSDGAIQAFFTTPSLIYPDKAKDRVAPPVEKAIIADIDTAKQSVDLVTFEYNLNSVADALIRAKERGVTVRLALDRESLANAPMAKWTGLVEAAQIPIAWEDSDAFLHSKFIIVDGSLLWTGSWNVTINDTYRNNNNLLRITAPAIIANYRAEFEQMAQKRFGNAKQSVAPNPQVRLGNTLVENYFSPQDRAQSRIVARIEEARQSIRFLAFSFTSGEIADAMIARSQAGVGVQGVMENRNVTGTGAKFKALQQGGVAIFADGNCYTMHHKLIIIDERTVITGSYNFTNRAEETNDENFLIIDDPALARQFLDEFDRVYSQAQSPTRCER